MKKIYLFLLLCVLLSSFCYGAVKTDSQKLDDLDKKINDVLNKIPSSYLYVHGTEYQPNQDIKVWLQLLNASNHDVNNGICYFYSYYPNNTIFYPQTKMNKINDNSIYYYDIPNINLPFGVYPVIAECYYTAQQLIAYPNNYFLNIGTAPTSDLTRLLVIDNNNFKFKEALSGINRRIDVGYNITNVSKCVGINQDLLKSISVSVTAKFDSVILDNIQISIFNFTSQTYKLLPNMIPEGNFFTSVTNTILLNNVTKSGLYKSGLGSIVRFTDTGLIDGADSELEVDQFFISCDILSNPQWQEVKGSSEIHITDINDNLNITDNINFDINQSTQNILNSILNSKNEINSNIDNLTFLNISVSVINNVSLNVTIDLNNISNSLLNITNETQETNEGLNMIAFILLFIVGLLLLIFKTDDVLIDMMNIVLNIIQTYLFWINDLQILSYFTILIVIVLVGRIYTSKENATG